MQSTEDRKLGGLQSTFSRRDLIKGAAALTAAAGVPEAFGQQATGAPFGTVWLYIGTYTGAPGAFGSNGMGIYLCELNLSTGALTVLRLVGPVVTTGIATNSPSTLALDPTRTHLYAGNEYGPPGAVTAYSIDRLTGNLTRLNSQPTKGAPAYVGVDKKGKYLFAAEYTGAWFEAFPINADGSLGPAAFQQFDADHPHHYVRPYTVDNQGAWRDPIQVSPANSPFRFSTIDAMQYNGAPLIGWRGC